MNIALVTDSCCDLSRDFVEKNNIRVMPIRVDVNGKEILDDLGKTLTHKEFYNGIREGYMPTTAQVNTYDFIEVFKECTSMNMPVIYIGFSSALSGCVNSATLAKKIVEEENDKVDITIVDSKSASLGLGALVYYAVNLVKEGKSKEEVVSWLEDNKLKMNHWFTVDDLNHLKRGGRISATAATVGGGLNIKPIMHVDNEGRLIPICKVRGRKKALKTLVDKIDEKTNLAYKQTIFISHGDCFKDAKFLKELILSNFNIENVIINEIGPSIGSHTGPGVIALFFMGLER